MKKHLVILIKGIAMGAADVVPGVSGGTIAFITGIYETFINALKSFDAGLIRAFKSGGIRQAWAHVNGAFLTALFAGIGISVFSLARLINYLLENHPVLLWSFFFGLIIASAIMISGKIARWSAGSVTGLLAGAAIAWYIGIAAPANTPEVWWFIFLSGMIAICAMILPGISGSFILVLLGKYLFMMSAIASMDFAVIGIFAAGCVAGLLSFSHVLSWMFKKFHDITIAILTGFLVGSLSKVWPWKETAESITAPDGHVIPVVQHNVLPGDYHGDAHLVAAWLLAVAALILVFLIERLGNRPATDL